VSHAADFDVSQPAVPSGQQAWPAAAGGDGLKSFTPTIPRAATTMTIKMIFVKGLLFFGGQQSPSHPQSFCLPADPCRAPVFSFSSIFSLFRYFAISLFLS
jgi:hypothetical protein